MISATEIQRHLADLTYFQTSLTNLGLNTKLINQQPENPIPFLAVGLPDTYTGPPAEMQLIYHSADSLLEATSMLQIQIYLLEALPIDHPKLAALMAKINADSLMGYFGFNDSSILYFRYVYSLPRYIVPDEAAFLEIMVLAIGNFNEVAGILLKISKGALDVDTLMEEV